MTRTVTFPELVEAAQDLLMRPDRQFLAIAGAPGSGKSTLAETLFEILSRTHPGTVAILPMDGFHYDDAVLHARGRRPWKGAPDTFDVGGLRSILMRLAAPSEGAVAVPVFDRDLEISRGSARIVEPEIRLVLVEGNYLLLEDHPWASLHDLFDLTVMIDAHEAELRRRLRKRWEGFGLTEPEIEFKLEKNDLPNGQVVRDRSLEANLVVRLHG